jgi:3-methyladenine DNA glycosylase/8-oxoguanine DNA glycosylase
MRLGHNEFWRATLTPYGPGTLRLQWHAHDVHATAWGPGADWLLQQVPSLLGAEDDGHVFVDAHPVIMAAQRNHPPVVFGASGSLYHEILPIILQQRITSGEALGQWQRLVRRLGERAPGPLPDLLLPPTPQRLLDHPSWWFHPLGIEAKRADALRIAARHAESMWSWSAAGAGVAARQLAMLPGIGEWTIGSVIAAAHGCPDSVAVGDYHIKNIVAWALAGEPRATDERMLELLRPYTGQRNRVVELLGLEGYAAPKFGPRQRILPMSQW